jgi:hypothetical protein
MDLDKLKSKLAADLNATQSQEEANAKQAAGETGKPSDPAQKQIPPADSSSHLPQQQVEQGAAASFSDDSVDRFLPPDRVWPD